MFWWILTSKTMTLDLSKIPAQQDDLHTKRYADHTEDPDSSVGRQGLVLYLQLTDDCEPTYQGRIPKIQHDTVIKTGYDSVELIDSHSCSHGQTKQTTQEVT